MCHVHCVTNRTETIIHLKVSWWNWSHSADLSRFYQDIFTINNSSCTLWGQWCISWVKQMKTNNDQWYTVRLATHVEVFSVQRCAFCTPCLSQRWSIWRSSSRWPGPSKEVTCRSMKPHLVKNRGSSDFIKVNNSLQLFVLELLILRLTTIPVDSNTNPSCGT